MSALENPGGSRSRFLGELGAAATLGALIGLVAALVEGTALQIVGNRGPQSLLDWLHSVWIYSYLGAVLAVALGTPLVLMRLALGFPESSRRIVGVGVVTGLTIGIGGYWFSTWRVVPPLSNLPGALLGGFLALAVAALILWLSNQTLPLRSLFVDATRTGTSILGVSVLVLGLVPLWLLPNPLAGSFDQHHSSGSAKGPPVILIIIDTLRRDHLGSYGYALPTSPNIDSLAEQSILFLSSSTTGNHTVPSTATLFTGLYPSAHGVTGPGRSLPEAVMSLPEIFQAAGYRTGAIVANPLVRADLGFGRGFNYFSPSPPPRWIYHRKTAIELIYLRFVRGKTPWGTAEDLIPRAVDWLGKRSSKPAFLYLHLIEPHSEYAPPPEYAIPFLTVEPQSFVARPPLIQQFFRGDEWQTWSELEEKPTVSDHERRSMVGLYDGEINYVDHWIGFLLANLESMGLLNDSLIVLASDHGEEFDDHGGWVHGNTLFEEMIGMPLMIKLPGGARAGARSQLSIDMVDLRATLAGLAELEAPDTSGKDYSDILFDPDSESAATVQYYTERPPQLYSLRVGDWKIVRRDRTDSSTFWLYNLSADPGELSDLATEYPEERLALEAALDEAIQTARGSTDRVEDEIPQIDPEAERILRALGYIQ